MTYTDPSDQPRGRRKPRKPTHIKPVIEAEMEKQESLKFAAVEETIYPGIVDG